MRLLISVFLPWLTFFTIGRPIAGIICLIGQIFLIGWIPATIWAVYASRNNKDSFKSRTSVVALSLLGLFIIGVIINSNTEQEQSNTKQEQKKQYEKALATYNDFITRFGNSQDPKIQEQVAKALVNKEIILGRLDHDEAIAIVNDLITRFGNSQDPKIQEQVIKALFNMETILENLNRDDDAIATLDDLITRFSNSQDPKIQEQVIKALFNMEDIFTNLNRDDDAIATLDDLITRFGNSQDPQIQRVVADAREVYCTNGMEGWMPP